MPRLRTEEDVIREVQELLAAGGNLDQWTIQRAYRITRPRQTNWYAELRHFCGWQSKTSLTWMRGEVRRRGRIGCRRGPTCFHWVALDKADVAGHLARGAHLQDIAAAVGV